VEVEVQFNRIGRVLDMRWVSSNFRTVLHAHFSARSSDTSTDGNERSKFLRLAKKLESPVFIKNLDLMVDALDELSDLSLALQETDITLPLVNKRVHKEIEILESRKQSDAEYYTEACCSVSDRHFKGVSVAVGRSRKEQFIDKEQFYQALADALRARLFPDSEKKLINATETLNYSLFPCEMSPEFGKTEIKLLCAKFGMSFSDVKFSYSQFRGSRGVIIAPQMFKLISCVNTIPASTAQFFSL